MTASVVNLSKRPSYLKELRHIPGRTSFQCCQITSSIRNLAYQHRLKKANNKYCATLSKGVYDAHRLFVVHVCANRRVLIRLGVRLCVHCMLFMLKSIAYGRMFFVFTCKHAKVMWISFDGKSIYEIPYYVCTCDDDDEDDHRLCMRIPFKVNCCCLVQGDGDMWCGMQCRRCRNCNSRSKIYLSFK